MKFTKRYETYMRGIRLAEQELPAVGLKRLKKMLKKCRSHRSPHHKTTSSSSGAAADDRCPGHCSDPRVLSEDLSRCLLVLLLSEQIPPVDSFMVCRLILTRASEPLVLAGIFSRCFFFFIFFQNRSVVDSSYGKMTNLEDD